MSERKELIHTLYGWAAQFADPLRLFRAVPSLVWYIQDWRKYSRLKNAESLRLINSLPQLHDRTSTTPFDQHYFWMSSWATRRIMSQKPNEHIDLASHNLFVGMLSAVVPVTFLDYRPLSVCLAGLESKKGDILDLPLVTDSVQSLSSLSVAEHIGLGRYGDPLNPDGTRQACAEMMRVLAPGGNLFFALPVGKSRVCFNAHRIHAPEAIMDYFSGLELIEFSVVDDRGNYLEDVSASEFGECRFACGMFWFKKPHY